MEVSNAVRASREDALLLPSSLSVLRVDGPDRVSWLNGLVTCDVTKLIPGRAMYGLVVEKKGKILSDLLLASTEEAILIGAPRERASAVLDVFDHHLIMESCEIARVHESMQAVWGPRAAERVAGRASVEHDRSGHGGVIVVLPEGDEPAFRETFPGVVASPEGATAARVAAGVPAFGVDFGIDTYPQEASLEHVAVSFTKGCYMGQEVVFMLQNRGRAKRRLVRLRLDAPAGAQAAVVSEAGDPLGDLTSAAVVEGVPLGLAMVRAKAPDGARVVVRGASGDVGATVELLR